jgi:heavy metal sensor kinase
MSSKSPFDFVHTLAFRLTLWYAGIFAVSSCVAFLLFYALITSVIHDRTNQELLGQARKFGTILSTAGMEEVTKTAVLEAQAAGVRKVFFRLLYPSGVAFSSSNMSYWQNIAVDPRAIQALLNGANQVFETITIPDRKEEIRILYVRLSPGAIAQIGQTMESYSRFLDAFKGIFAGTMAFLIVLAAGIGWFMARRAVSGVEAVTHAARQISGGALDERVPVKTRGDEVDQLAITFNQMVDRIQTVLKEMKEMSDNIAHDLKSPITRIRGNAEVTLTTGKSLEEFEGMAESTVEECDRLLDMINTMLLISKTEAGVETAPHGEIDLSAIVRDVCELFQPSAEDSAIAFNCEIEAGIGLKGDIRMIQRMLSNLLDNAIKYTASGGKVDVTLSREGSGKIIISVTDSGIGISPGDLSHIFERFYRGDQSRTKPGIGLGLSLAKAIVRAHGGDISVKSAPGQGSTFTVTFPGHLPHCGFDCAFAGR